MWGHEIRYPKQLLMENFIIKTGRANHHLIKLGDLEYIHADKGRTIVMTDGEEINTALTFHELLDDLKGSLFRCHRSFAINLNLVKGFTHDSIRLPSRSVPLGAKYLEDFKKIMFDKTPLLQIKNDVDN